MDVIKGDECRMQSFEVKVLVDVPVWIGLRLVIMEKIYMYEVWL
jgi:hypothetical protein